MQSNQYRSTTPTFRSAVGAFLGAPSDPTDSRSSHLCCLFSHITPLFCLHVCLMPCVRRRFLCASCHMPFWSLVGTRIFQNQLRLCQTSVSLDSRSTISLFTVSCSLTARTFSAEGRITSELPARIFVLWSTLCVSRNFTNATPVDRLSEWMPHGSIKRPDSIHACSLYPVQAREHITPII